jgi:hypothetical protein
MLMIKIFNNAEEGLCRESRSARAFDGRFLPRFLNFVKGQIADPIQNHAPSGAWLSEVFLFQVELASSHQDEPENQTG